ncbi:MAG: hypothetical protein ACI8TX_002442 [Hyphomicrobiaceae bacterium]|jgi:hypothetical protein
MNRVRWALALIASPLLAAALVTALALEGQEVVVVHTSTADGTVRQTRTWIAKDPAGRIWLEANNPSSPWLLDVLKDPELLVQRGGENIRYRAQPDPSAPRHARVRGLMAAKYGWADTWVGMLFASPHSIAVRLLPTTGPAKL